MLFLSFVILGTIFGNSLVILSVCVYQRMQTFTNFLLTSLGTADLLVGIIIQPPAMLYDLNSAWPFSRFFCKIWATLDVLLCTASILSLCIISLDRYFAISWPLGYLHKRNKRLALGLVLSVWSVSLLVCLPPWLRIHTWGFVVSKNDCGYVPELSYRIYSACGSFFVPLAVMLFVYSRIFKVTVSREQALNVNRSKSMHVKIHRGGGQKKRPPSIHLALGNPAKALAITGSIGRKNRALKDAADNLQSVSNSAIFKSPPPPPPQTNFRHFITEPSHHELLATTPETENKSSLRSTRGEAPIAGKEGGIEDSDNIGGERRSSSDSRCQAVIMSPTETPETDLPTLTVSAQRAYRRTAPAHLIAKAQCQYSAALTHHRDRAILETLRKRSSSGCCNTFNAVSPSSARREKPPVMKEQKALKTIALVVSGFVFCWFPFFVTYILESACPHACHIPPRLRAVFLWLGYSNSILNPVIYAWCNRDFRRCFRDLLSLGCIRKNIQRSISIRRLHQSRL